MRYYCNICKKYITKAEFLYSVKFFDRPLCREHQNLELLSQYKPNQSERLERPISEQEPIVSDPEEIMKPDEIEDDTDTGSRSGWKTLGRAAAKMGKGVFRGVKKIVDSSKKRSQIRKWKGAILRRMKMTQLKRFCYEQKISTTKSVLEEDKRSEDLYWKKYDCTKGELIARLRNKLSLKIIISFANRNHINIKDIQIDIDRKKTEWEMKELIEKISKNGSTFLLELVKTIKEFAPMRQYNTEIPYQDSLTSFLKSRYPKTRIEVSRGATRPDIVVKGIAIEVKGPTSYKDLQTVADKCLRYPQYFPNGMICVLFNVNVSEYRYAEWLKGMNTHYPDVKVIKI